MNVQTIQELFDHMQWADAVVWKAVGGLYRLIMAAKASRGMELN